MIIVKSRNGELSLHDMYSTEYGVPREDSEQNVYAPTVIGTHVNGVLRAQFTRKRDTGDRKADHHFSDTKCYKFLFPVSGGRLEPVCHVTFYEFLYYVNDLRPFVAEPHSVTAGFLWNLGWDRKQCL